MVELVVVLAIIGLLLGLLLPATQSAREAARLISCQNNLREFTLTSKNYCDAFNMLPESRVIFSPDSSSVVEERTWGRTVAPFIMGNVANDWANSSTAYNDIHSDLYSSAPNILQCPSSLPREKLKNFSAIIGQPVVSELTTETVDYRGNLGVLDFNFPDKGIGGAGPFAILRNNSPPIKENTVTDGYSHTVFAWETVGAGVAQSSKTTIEVLRRQADTSPQIIFFEHAERDAFSSTPNSSMHGHYSGWPGFFSGYVSVIWVGSETQFRPHFLKNNFYGDPFSLHPSGVNFSMCDGRILRLSRDIDWQVLKAIVQKNDQRQTPSSLE